MEIIGHRGCADQYPENTVHAVQRSSRYLDTIEVDVRRCGSGELVVFHDETVDRLTDATGRVTDLDWTELRELEVMDSGETIPRLSTVLEAFPRGVRAQVELKGRGLAEDVRDVVAGSDVEVAVSSFDIDALAEVHDLGWDVRTGYLFESNPAGNLAAAVELGCAVVHPYYDLCLKTDVVDDAHEAGLEVVAWKAARTAEEVAALRTVGVDGVTADRWDIG
ncbi:glycerophosphodiester phosphodiesterase [Halorarum halophilum]|uniref:Glycerophosphodiester phosphodiesterase n=1 Tax=Halorarum halophilum TaxID=2743090 RepID=A0A7D5GFM2_9EURY|nr:glycerophosphodiester phosphodiesterase [Halobaculum halophilum]QLG27870.1 glycerophosphodiester phosphodiesterase [Halobaculum halophilum]